MLCSEPSYPKAVGPAASGKNGRAVYQYGPGADPPAGKRTVLRIVGADPTRNSGGGKSPLCVVGGDLADAPLFNQLLDHIMAFENYPLDMEALKSKEKDLGFSIAGLDAFEQDSYGLGLIIYPGTNG